MAAAALPSTRDAPIRRFIYLIMDGGNDVHTLHRIDTSPLFAGGWRAQAQQEAEATQRVAAGGRARHGPEATATPPGAEATLPRPLARFDCAAGRQFLPLGGGGVEKIASVDRNRHTVIFDTRTESVRAGPDARHAKLHAHGSTWAEAGGRLYHLGRGPVSEEQDCVLDFEALTYDGHRDDWFWSLLPSPPLESQRYKKMTIESFADAGDGAASATIRISTRDGTYAFDPARASWRKEGDWALPFRGRAQYVADYGLWFGFADGRATDLCAADLDAAGRPVRRHVWTNVDGHAKQGGVWLERSFLSYLGGGRFCVTRFFRETDKDGRRVVTAVVTAVEATRERAAAAGSLRMVKRASVRYHCPAVSDSPGWTPCWAY